MNKVIIVLVTTLLISACTGAANPPASEGLQIDDLQVEVTHMGLKPEISVSIQGHLPDGCTAIEKREGSVQRRLEGDTFYITINPTRREDPNCAAAPQPFDLQVGLQYDQLSAGEYVVDVHGERTTFTLSEDAGYEQEEIEAVLAAVRAELAANWGAEEVDILNIERVEWANACLEMPEAGDVCAQTLTPGYRLTAGDGESSWEVHSNQDGSQVRVKAWDE